MRNVFVTILSLAALAAAIPQACQSNNMEKIHEGHGHNINNGHVGSKDLGLKLPGGSGCYKGQKVEGASASAGGGKLGKSGGKSSYGKMGKGSKGKGTEESEGHSHAKRRSDWAE